MEFGRPRGYDRFDEERTFTVVRGEPSFPIIGLGILSGGVIAGLAAILLFVRWARGKLRPV